MSLRLFLKKKAFSYSLNFIDRVEKANLAYSQEGEDLLLGRIFEGKKEGFFIDIGAHHPKLFSNTYMFYRKGWRGINIDPLPGVMDLFNQVRPNDINLEVGISEKEGVLTYYMFDEPALNTFSKEVMTERASNKRWKLLGEKQIQTRRLEDILDHHLPKNTKIDFMSIDVEGLDLQVLLSNNWGKYRPKVILVEHLNCMIEEVLQSELYRLMKQNNYAFYAKTVNTLFFIESEIS